MASPEPQKPHQLTGKALTEVTELLQGLGVYFLEPTTPVTNVIQELNMLGLDTPSNQPTPSYFLPDPKMRRTPEPEIIVPRDTLMPPGLIMLARIVQDMNRGQFKREKLTPEGETILEINTLNTANMYPTYFVKDSPNPIINVTDFLLEQAVTVTEPDPDGSKEDACNAIKVSIMEIANRSEIHNAPYGVQRHVVSLGQKDFVQGHLRIIAHSLKIIYSDADPRYASLSPHKKIDALLREDTNLVENARTS
jgi:hypothetical protein